MQSTELESIDHHICGSVWTSPLRLIESISYDFGPRPSGSKALRDATAFVATLWRDLGVENVHTETVAMTAWRQAHAAVKMASPQKRHYDCFQHNFSSPGKVTARLLSAGNAFEEDLDRIGKRIEGSILLIDGMVHGLPEKEVALFPRRIARIDRRKPAGIIFANAFPHAGAVIETASVLGNASIPVMGISYEDGCELKSFVRQGETVMSIEAEGDSYDTQCMNLIGEMGPTSDDVVVLSCHLDTHAGTLGSFDNLSGLAGLVEIVRALAPFQNKFRRRLRLISFTGEEYLNLGSKAYVQRHEAELDQIKFVFNMDGLFPATSRGIAVMWSPQMKNCIEAYLRQTQCCVDIRNYFCMASDYLPFMLKGIAAARPADWEHSFPQWTHTKLDTPPRVPMEWIRLNAMPFAQLMVRLLMDPQPLPTSRKSREQVRHLVEEEDVAEDLHYYGFDV